MTTQEKTAKMIEELEKLGYDMNDLADLVRNMSNVKILSDDKEESKSLKWRISDICRELGILQNIRGYNYLRYGIELTYDNPEEIKRITKTIYPSIAKKFDTTPNKVETTIRYAIDLAFENGSKEALEKYFGSSFSPMKGKTTNSQFIAGIADWLRLQDGK